MIFGIICNQKLADKEKFVTYLFVKDLYNICKYSEEIKRDYYKIFYVNAVLFPARYGAASCQNGVGKKAGMWPHFM